MTPDGAWLRPRGSSQSGMSHFNERVLLQAIRLNGGLPQADLARLTRLSTQAVALIVRRLAAQGLVVRSAPRRGKVGQPSVPIMLDPDGAYFIGVQVGRRGVELLLVDFAGHIRARDALAYRHPDPDLLFGQIDAGLQALRRQLGPRQAARLRGIGVAAPLSLGGWQTLLGGDAQQAARWDRIDLRAGVQACSDVPVVFAKDTVAACVAELVAGHGRSLRSFVYIFVGTFIGGALVLDSSVHAGLKGNAGALGSLPLACGDEDGAPAQLLSTASLFALERRYLHAGLDQRAAHDARALQRPWLAHTEAWLEGAARAIALAACNATCLVDVGHVVLDSSAHPALLARLLERSTQALSYYRWEGVRRPSLQGGVIGADARAVGAALLPLHANFAPDRDLFLKILSAAA
ncbi:ROK family transcriptional regulator [Pseudoduganella armeniaca]|uniref:Serine/threonine protein kinase n=1 Tax=Pseudoduganella armeniaca TaxID=2072590 RepID=A0A2R4CE35_9BURK|nr:ROK family transcriptional regulator [Pseudoduganella armeniaca]AVR97822.1 serine/threonine protein kinase [Pseudoduganella armeniaca]